MAEEFVVKNGMAAVVDFHFDKHTALGLISLK